MRRLAAAARAARRLGVVVGQEGAGALAPRARRPSTASRRGWRSACRCRGRPCRARARRPRGSLRLRSRGRERSGWPPPSRVRPAGARPRTGPVAVRRSGPVGRTGRAYSVARMQHLASSHRARALGAARRRCWRVAGVQLVHRPRRWRSRRARSTTRSPTSARATTTTCATWPRSTSPRRPCWRLAARRPSWRAPALALVGLQYALHALNHLLDVGDADPSWVGPFDLVSLAVGAACSSAALCAREASR